MVPLVLPPPSCQRGPAAAQIGLRCLLVSGLGSSTHASPVGNNRHTLFAHSNTDRGGFMQIDFLRDDRVRLAVIESAGSADMPPNEVYSTFLTPS